MRTVLMVAMLVALAAPAGAQERLADQLRKGIAEEETTQNLDKAIQAYQAIVARYDEDRKVAGSALFRLAECYRKIGKREQAIAAYQRVLREFPDQQAIADTSFQQLTGHSISEAKVVQPERAPAARVERPREVTPERAEWPRAAPPERASTIPVESLEATKIEMEQVQRQLARAQDLFQKKLITSSDVQDIQTRLRLLQEKMYQQQSELQLKHEMILSLQKEIALVQNRIAAIEAKIQVGTASSEDAELLQLRRELIGLQFRVQELQLAVRR